MISTARVFDRELVREFVADHGVDPVPKASEPRSIAREGIQLVVEDYDWGRVCFAEWKARDVGLTWIERDGRPVLPAWAEGIRAILDRPTCLGYHEEDHVCDGGKNPETGEREPACRWRRACMYAQTLAKTPARIPHVLAHTSDDDLWDRGAAMFPDGRGAQSEETIEKAVATIRRKNAENLATSRQVVDAIVARFCELGGWVLAPSRFRSTVGQFFVVEHSRAASSRNELVVLFRRRPRSWEGEVLKDSTTEQSIARLFPHSVKPTCTVQIRTAALELVREACPKLAVNRASAGSYEERQLVTVRGVTADRVDAVALAMVRVVQGGLLTAWGIGATDSPSAAHWPSTLRGGTQNRRRGGGG